MTVIRTELDALLERVREDKADTTGKNRLAVAFDCWRMFEDLAAQFKEESEMRDRYKRQSNSWRDQALLLADALNLAITEKRNEQAENTRLREIIDSGKAPSYDVK